MTKGGIIDNTQAVWLLKNTGYLPDDMPDAKPKPAPQVVQLETQSGSSNNDDSDASSKGGENDD
jgi:hypothetical protein